MFTLDPNLHQLGVEILPLLTEVGIVALLEGWHHH